MLVLWPPPCSAALLALAWRLVDRGASYRRVGLITAYIFGGPGSALYRNDDRDDGRAPDRPTWVQRSVAELHASMAAVGARADAVDGPLRHRAVPRRGDHAARPRRGGLAGDRRLVRRRVGRPCVDRCAAARWQSWLATSIWVGLLAALVWLPLRRRVTATGPTRGRAALALDARHRAVRVDRLEVLDVDA
jgi:hypothetical protein